MKYGSICSGIHCDGVALSKLGWECAFVSEIDPYKSAVIGYRHPGTLNIGDFAKVQDGSNKLDLFTEINTDDDLSKIDVLIGTTPCQSFSIAGERGGLDDPRGNLAIQFLRFAWMLKPQWIVWENVPGVLSSSGGKDFKAFLELLVYCGYGWAYRVLDAQYAGVPQRRRRVFVVGYLGDWRPPVGVLFEPDGMPGNPPESCEKKEIAPTFSASDAGTARSGGQWAEPEYVVTGTIDKGYADQSGQNLDNTIVVNCLTASGVGTCGADDNQAHSNHIVAPLTTKSYADNAAQESKLIAHTLMAKGFIGDPDLETYSTQETVPRRLTPLECERLMGLPDNYTLIPWRGGYAPDTLRYQAIGDGVVVPVVEAIGARIQFMDGLI